MIPQDPDYAYCVPNVLHDVIVRYGVEDVDVQDVVRWCDSHKSRGTFIENTKPFLADHGLKYRRLQFTFDGIYKHLRKGTPIVATYGAAQTATHTSSHFTAIYAIIRQDHKEWIILDDPLYGRIPFVFETFKVLWKMDESWARVVVKL
jgi:hypothetical protein